MQGIKRRVVYVSLYEFIAVVLTSVTLALLGHGLAEAGVAAIVTSLIAIVWNLIWNAVFEFWEARQSIKGRSVRRRVAHAIGFEGGLIIAFVPFFAWWLDVTLWEAFILDIGFIVFFLIYTFVFSLCFDKVFGLPASAMPSNAVPETAPGQA